MRSVALNIIVSIKCCRCARRSSVQSKGKKIQAQIKRHAIRNNISFVRRLSQPTTITLDTRLSCLVGNWNTNEHVRWINTRSLDGKEKRRNNEVDSHIVAQIISQTLSARCCRVMHPRFLFLRVRCCFRSRLPDNGNVIFGRAGFRGWRFVETTTVHLSRVICVQAQSFLFSFLRRQQLRRDIMRKREIPVACARFEREE